MADPLVLLVDDEPQVLRALERDLRAEPLRVVTAVSTRAAKQALDGAAPALVICDLNLPDGGGEAVLREVRGRVPSARTVLLTGASRDEAAALIDKGLADATLEKPWSVDELLRVVRLCLALSDALPEVDGASAVVGAVAVS